MNTVNIKKFFARFLGSRLRGNDTELSAGTWVIPTQAGIHADAGKSSKKLFVIT
jgi:hypothetical protein